MTDPTQKGPPPQEQGGGGPGAEQQDPRISIIYMIAETLKTYFPNGIPDEMLIKIAEMSFLESDGIKQVFDDAIPGTENQATYPFWQLRVWFAGRPDQVTVVAAPKVLSPTDMTIDVILRQLNILGLIASPWVRGFARLYGVEFAFGQSRSLPANLVGGTAPIIIAPGTK